MDGGDLLIAQGDRPTTADLHLPIPRSTSYPQTLASLISTIPAKSQSYTLWMSRAVMSNVVCPIGCSGQPLRSACPHFVLHLF